MRGDRNLALVRQPGQKCLDFAAAQGCRVTHTVETDEGTNPVDISLFGSVTNASSVCRLCNWSRTLTERSGGNGAVAVFMACYDCFFVQSMPRASKQQARYAVGRCLMLWSSNDVTQQGSRPKTKLYVELKAI